jgi:hypothetical protein
MVQCLTKGNLRSVLYVDGDCVAGGGGLVALFAEEGEEEAEEADGEED